MKCKPYRAEIPERTCISRQHIIETLADKTSDWHNMGPYTIIHEECKKCSKGKALYAKAKATGDIPDVKRRILRPAASKGEIEFIAYQAKNACVGW